MNQASTHIRFRLLLILLWGVLSFSQSAKAQAICANPGVTAYGLNGNGKIYPIDMSTAITGAAINPNYTTTTASSSNAIGYNNVNGKFYYFKRNANSTLASQEFVSYDPATSTYQVLADYPNTNITIFTGCVSANGQGYYCLDAQARLYYYNIATNTWKLITSTFLDTNGFSVTQILKNRTGGDIAIDGFGRLWILCSSGTTYGLYNTVASAPTATIASITLSMHLNPNTATPNGSGFAGIAFTPTGQIILSTLDDKLYRMENDLTLTLLANISVSGAGTDLTSCNFPLTVLRNDFIDISVQYFTENRAWVSWSVQPEMMEKSFQIETSVNGSTWELAGTTGGQFLSNLTRTYKLPINIPNSKCYIRVKAITLENTTSLSPVKIFWATNKSPLKLWPNPAKNDVHFSTTNLTSTHKIQIFDQAGRLEMELVTEPGINEFNIHQLPTGTYQLHIKDQQGNVSRSMIMKL